MGQQVKFSERERQVNELLVQGRSNKQIALALGISVRAVEFHLSHIYAKLGVNSRTEAALKLAESRIRESTVVEMGKPTDNEANPISTRRISMKNLAFMIGGLFLTTLVIILFVINLPVVVTGVPPATTTSMPTATVAIPTQTPAPILSAREHILEQIRQLVAEYDQAVQAEKKNGKVEFSKDPNTGAELFLFKDDSYIRILDLNEKLWENINQLNALYVQVYRDELKPTPFPTQSSPEEERVYYDSLLSQTRDHCSDVWNLKGIPGTLVVYRPDEGKYLPIGTGDEYARCETYGQMIEEWRTAPLLAKVNKDSDMALIKQVMGKPDLKLVFQSITELANAPWQSAALYTDETGAKYYVDIGTAALAAIEPNYPSHPEISSAETKSMDELRIIAEQFAAANSPRLAQLKNSLLYEEGCKGNICFFRWDYRNKDWSGTDWAMMPPFLQVGVLVNGQIATYNNTLDLFK
jgi:DNA-binding CsgD family transcriptional regulator